MIWKSWKRTSVGSMFMICGTVQLASGIIFSIICDTFLRNASNAWTGIFNLIFGTALISPFSKQTSLICMFSVTTLLNISNLILLEFVNWKIPKSNSKPLSKDADYLTYLLTTIPSVTIIFIAVLVGSSSICKRIMKKHSLPQKQDNRNSIYEKQSYYNWVFKESEPWSSYYDDALELNDKQLEEISSDTETNSVDNSEHMLTFNASIKTLNVLPVVHKTGSSTVQYQSLSRSSFSRVRLSGVSETFSLPYRNFESHTTKKIEKAKSFTTSKKISNSKPSVDIHRSNSDANYRPFIKEFNQSNSDLHRNSTIKSSLFPTSSSPKPFDNDSLVNLKQLELLARQWRFQAQHKALRRQFSFQVVNKRYSTNL